MPKASFSVIVTDLSFVLQTVLTVVEENVFSFIRFIGGKNEISFDSTVVVVAPT